MNTTRLSQQAKHSVFMLGVLFLSTISMGQSFDGFFGVLSADFNENGQTEWQEEGFYDFQRLGNTWKIFPPKAQLSDLSSNTQSSLDAPFFASEPLESMLTRLERYAAIMLVKDPECSNPANRRIALLAINRIATDFVEDLRGRNLLDLPEKYRWLFPNNGFGQGGGMGEDGAFLEEGYFRYRIIKEIRSIRNILMIVE
ncbi:hypothetical protein [Pontibacter sp. G13]|uniref:hypothetical protein n=1 Tax=Pontibacter sp. G13 TaxID=3074898 RepID=UPI00288A0EFF|nr:hypothetical protein [Pontibacter sp. G13]WNJ20737.1 hypothetical protein RJD25_09665 [Pontibacter sp. G13]